jgi:hypothetical protein
LLAEHRLRLGWRLAFSQNVSRNRLTWSHPPGGVAGSFMKVEQ